MTLRDMPTTSVYRHDEPTRFKREGVLVMFERTVYLMRGTDRSGQNDFRIRHRVRGIVRGIGSAGP